MLTEPICIRTLTRGVGWLSIEYPVRTLSVADGINRALNKKHYLRLPTYAYLPPRDGKGMETK